MMNRIKKALVTALMVTGITVGATVVAPVATAEPAQAYTATQCYKQWYNGWRLDTICYYDYNWFEESPWGGSHKDGWYRTGTTYA